MRDLLTSAEIVRRHAAGEPIERLVDALRGAIRSLACPVDFVDYARGLDDFKRGIPSPDLSSLSCDLGRLLAAPPGEEQAAVAAVLACELEARESLCRETWIVLTPAQHRAVLFLRPGRVLVRCRWSRNYYDAVGEPYAIAKAARLDTVRVLAARRLVGWDGGATDPERRAVATERVRFVIQHGRTEAAP